MNFATPFNSIKKNKLWFLQTHLTPSEIKKVTGLLRFEEQTQKNDLKKILQKVILKEERLQHILKNFEKEDNLQNTTSNIITYFEMSALLQKEIPYTSTLAFEFSGNIQVLKRPLIAIIGSRQPTYYGREQAHRFAKSFAKAGCTILSGGALGIDAIANAVALEHGPSCAIIGSGIKKLYPASNLWLFQNLMNSPRGLILSEFSTYESAQKWNFPRRNYSIAALADFVLIIEATLTSGSLITANAAADFGVDVGAIPGAVHNINSEGTNRLIKNGAFIIQKPEDVLERVFRFQGQRIKSYDLSRPALLMTSVR